MMKKSGIVIAAVGVFLLSACSSSAHKKLGEVPKTAEQRQAWKEQWSSAALSGQKEGALHLLPSVQANVVYTADAKGAVVAESLDQGKVLWKSSIGKGITAGVGLSGSQVFVVSEDATLHALDMHSGKVHWKVKLPSIALSRPVADDKHVYIQTNDSSISAFALETGHLVWVVEQTQPGLIFQGGSTPALWGNELLVGTNEGKLISVDKLSGSVLWERVIAEPKGRTEVERMVDVVADIQVRDDKALVATYQGRVASVQLENQVVEWQRDFSVYQNLSVDKQAVYLVDADHTLWALDRESGATLWQQAALKERLPTAPVVVGSELVLLDRGGMLYWVDAIDGRLLASNQLSDDFRVAPYRVNDRAFLAYGEQGRLFYWMR